jgi:hypothetical protein
MAFNLSDDGTMDTVVTCSECGATLRYNFDGGEPGKRFALVSNQGTMMPETVLTEQEYADDNVRAFVEATAPADARMPFAWEDVTENAWFYDQFVEWAIEDATADHVCGENN